MLKGSIGLRTPELFPDTAEGILEIPRVFKEVLISYFEEMYDRGKILNNHFESMAMIVLSMNFGFVLLKASFGDKLTQLEKEQYITDSVRSYFQALLQNRKELLKNLEKTVHNKSLHERVLGSLIWI